MLKWSGINGENKMSKEVEIYVNIFSLLFSIKCVIMCSLVHFKFIKKRRKWGKLLELTILFYISASMPISLVIPNIWPYTWSSIYKRCITWINYLIVPVLFYYSMCVYLMSIKSRSGVVSYGGGECFVARQARLSHIGVGQGHTPYNPHDITYLTLSAPTEWARKMHWAQLT